MVYCIYCGEKNEDETLKCRKCGKPLSLLPHDYPENSDSKMPNYINKKRLNKGIMGDYQNNHDNFSQKSIESRYKDFNPYDDNFNENKYKNNQINKLNNLSSSRTNYNEDNYRKNLKKPIKNFVEWDVVVATALLVIILFTILQRFFHTIGLFIALFIGLIYILTATKQKSGLIKAIPLAIIMVFAISAYFSL